jgi:hypothetical protein
MAVSWAAMLGERRADLGLEEVLITAYRNVRRNNAELRDEAWVLPAGSSLADHADGLPPEELAPMASVYDRCSILIAPTQLSATAPLKLVGRQRGLRAATMPGFTEDMVPALRLDYQEIDRRCRRLKELLDPAAAARIVFEVDGTGREELLLDLRHRKAHASGGLQRETSAVGNLPSGETYVVPYEGEGEPTRSAGTMPVQFGDEVVLYRIEENVARSVISSGPRSEEEQRRLEAEPAYGNLAELGFGVLADFGVEPCGEILMDEKLGLHIAFGRSDHFGGQVGPSSFSSPEEVVHIDRVYIPQTQPRVVARQVVLEAEDGAPTTLMTDGRYSVELG